LASRLGHPRTLYLMRCRPLRLQCRAGMGKVLSSRPVSFLLCSSSARLTSSWVAIRRDNRTSRAHGRSPSVGSSFYWSGQPALVPSQRLPRHLHHSVHTAEPRTFEFYGLEDGATSRTSSVLPSASASTRGRRRGCAGVAVPVRVGIGRGVVTIGVMERVQASSCSHTRRLEFVARY